MTKHKVMTLNIGRVHTGTRLVVSLHRRNVAKGGTRMIETCMMSSIAKTHVARSKSGIRSASALNRSDMKRGTMTIRVFIMTNLTDNGLPKEGAMQEE
jgi:hypothetical protein